jgi:hypothetical protein
MINSYTTTATLSNKKTLILDEPIPLTSGRVRVTVEQLPEVLSGTAFLVKLCAIHQRLRESGYRNRSKEELDAQIKAERDSWEE